MPAYNIGKLITMASAVGMDIEAAVSVTGMHLFYQYVQGSQQKQQLHAMTIIGGQNEEIS